MRIKTEMSKNQRVIIACWVSGMVILIVSLFCSSSVNHECFASSAHSKNLVACVCYKNSYWQVFLVKEDSTSFKQVTSSPMDKAKISWSLKKDSLLVNTNLGEIFILDLNTRQEAKVNIGMKGMTDAVWSRDGRRILFSLSTHGSIDNNDIWIVDIVSGKRECITKMKHLQHNPVWTADEEKIVFLSGQGGQSHDICVMDLKSRAVKQVTAGQLYNFEPDCSCNNEIAFSSNRTGDYEIWVCDLEGKHLHQVTHCPGLDSQPSWSPDGKKIAFVSNRDGQLAVWVINRDGSNLRRLTPPNVACRAPAWSK
ncbi:MAG TPA: hypothetical protein ENI41_08935 [Deltaproteobacteria bacterium]|nr:hypothetical protein [Deltaproteobacteria bacterium]